MTTIHLRRFEYVPAAISGRLPNSFLGVKYEDNTDKKRLWKRIRFNGVTTHYLPDRTVSWGCCRDGAAGINMDEMDSFMLISPSTHPQVLNAAGFNYAMSSPLHVTTGSEPRRNPYVKFFSDSGGFQLISGALDWVDLDELADLYNRTIDYGIGLDIPTKGALQKKYLLRMCDVMCKNNAYLRERVLPEVEIYDVSHGNTLALRQSFLEKVLAYRKKAKLDGGGLAVGGIAQNMVDGGALVTIVNGTVNLMHVLLRSKGQFQRYHILGTTNSFFQFLYHVILARDAAPHITADSTSYVLPSAKNLMVITKPMADHRQVSLEVPKTHHSYMPNCCCPVCAQVGHLREYHVNYSANVIHSLYVVASQRDRIEETAQDYMHGRISLTDALKAVVGKEGKGIQHLVGVVRFAEDACELGFDKAWEKHHDKMIATMRDTRTVSIFGEGSQSPVIAKLDKRLDTILTRYEKFHSERRK